MTFKDILIALGLRPRPKLDHDDWPTGYEGLCLQARTAAYHWYCRKYGVSPVVPFTRVIVTGSPQNNGKNGGQATGYTIHIWAGQKPFMGSLEHEFRHVLNYRNGKGKSEEAVQ